MKKTRLLLLLVCLTILQSCWWRDQSDDISVNPPSAYSPVIMQRAAFEVSIEFESPKPIVNSGKIYVKDQFLFINEKNGGFHIFDNSNPENPINIGFLKALGSSDLAIKNDIIYINNAVDLIAIQPDFSTSTITVTKRIPNTFPQLFSPDGIQYYNLQEDEIIVNWTLND
jgi:hypothetical protein